MKSSIVSEGQSLIDIATQHLGSADAAYTLAALNGLSVTDELVPGRELQLPDVVNKQIASYYATKSIQPATVSEADATDLKRVFFEELPTEIS